MISKPLNVITFLAVGKIFEESIERLIIKTSSTPSALMWTKE